jgi:hypothetical protein
MPMPSALAFQPPLPAQRLPAVPIEPPASAEAQLPPVQSELEAVVQSSAAVAMAQRPVAIEPLPPVDATAPATAQIPPAAEVQMPLAMRPQPLPTAQPESPDLDAAPMPPAAQPQRQLVAQPPAQAAAQATSPYDEIAPLPPSSSLRPTVATASAAADETSDLRR